MATMKFVILAVACVTAYAFPDKPTGPVTKNTIFADEKFEGEIFENLESMEEFTLSRSTSNASLYRLPNTTVPRHYNILWQIQMTTLTMSGSVDIKLSATQANVNEIVINALDLNIGSVTLLQGTTAIPQTHQLDSVTQLMYITLTNGVLQYNANTPVEYTLTISFNAELRNDMYGIYRSWYRNNPSNPAEQVSWMASTQFQATYARAAFPCYDEPSFKATFDITIRRPTAFTSWSCTRRLTTEQNVVGYVDDVYTTTPVMSTYLLAIIVAEYLSKPHVENNQLMYEVIARPGAFVDGQEQYAYDVGLQLLGNMSAHTAIDFYSVSDNIKMTQAAIPDFGAGAMENWGLLTYREAYLLYDEANTNGYFKQLIAYILSHEIAHMWFGNLATCDWWDVLWLNEGFARYYQYFLTDSVEGYMGLGTRFIVEQVHTALLSDSSNNPHPLSTINVGSPRSVSNMFSTLSYNKGASIIRMTEHLLGSEVHTAGLRKYLEDFKFKTALPINLFESLEYVALQNNATEEYGPDFSFIDYYKSWTEEAGHPVLNVQVNHNTGLMTVYQRRFNINTGYAITNNKNYIVPVSFATASDPDFDNTKPTHIVSKAITTIQRGSIGDEWVVFNKQQTGFYRVNYDDYTWDLIAIQLQTNKNVIHKHNRAQIVNDVFQFARSGLMTYNRALHILSFLETETAYTPWVAALTGFSWLRNRLAGTPYLENVEQLLVNWSKNVIDQLTYYPATDESFMTSYLRYQLAPVLCLLDAPGCRTAATAQFNALIATPSIPVPVDSRNWVYCSALRTGNAATFNTLWTRFQTHNVYSEKILLLMNLGCTSNQASLNTLLNGIVQETGPVRPQDYTTAFSSAVTGNEANTQIVFQYIKDNLVDVIKAFGSAETPLSYVSSRLRSPAEILEFQTWVNETATVLGDEYEVVYDDAQASRFSLDFAEQIAEDLTGYFSTAPTPFTTTTAAPTTQVQVQTVTPQTLVQPATPVLPAPPATDAAASTYMSMLIIAVAVIINLLV